MAGIPVEVITKATTMLSHMQKKELATVEPRKQKNQESDTPQLSLF